MDSRDTLEFYKDKAGEVRWRYKAAGNNAILADSGEGYKELDDARSTAFRIFGLDSMEQFAAVLASGPVSRRDRVSPAVDVVYADWES